MHQRICIAVGGTAGHILPALRLADGINKRHSVFFAGVGLDKNPNFSRTKEPVCSIFGANFSSGFFSGLKLILKGVVKSFRFLREHKIQKVVGFGSFHSLPILLAAKLLRLDLYLYESNLQAGRVNSLFSRFANKSFTVFEETQGLGGKKESIGFLLNPMKKSASKEDLLQKYNLDRNKTTLLIYGGSLGSDLINQLARKIVPSLPEDFQFIHLLGRSKSSKEIQELYAQRQAYIAPYSHEMHELYTICDVALSRSGANTILEQIQYAIPSIHIPFKEAIKNHQVYNALFMQDKVQGSIMLEQEALSVDKIVHTLCSKEWLKQKQASLLLRQERCLAKTIDEYDFGF